MSEKIPIFQIKNKLGSIDVHDSWVTLSPKAGRRNKTIEYSEVRELHFKESGLLSGYLVFALKTEEARQPSAILAVTAGANENAFVFAGSEFNAPARRVKKFIEAKIRLQALPSRAEATGESTYELPPMRGPARLPKVVHHGLGAMYGTLQENLATGKVEYRGFAKLTPSFVVNIDDVTGVSGQNRGMMVRMKVHGSGSILAEADVVHGEVEQVEAWFRKRAAARASQAQCPRIQS